jgi:hypothetical protein
MDGGTFGNAEQVEQGMNSPLKDRRDRKKIEDFSKFFLSQ